MVPILGHSRNHISIFYANLQVFDVGFSLLSQLRLTLSKESEIKVLIAKKEKAKKLLIALIEAVASPTILEAQKKGIEEDEKNKNIDNQKEERGRRNTKILYQCADSVLPSMPASSPTPHTAPLCDARVTKIIEG